MGQSHSQSQTHISVLPNEVAVSILQHLAPQEIKSAVLVCKSLREMGEKPGFWTWAVVVVNTKDDLEKFKSPRLQLVQEIDVTQGRRACTKVQRQWIKEEGLADLFRVIAEIPTVKRIRGLEFCKGITGIEPDLVISVLNSLEELNLCYGFAEDEEEDDEEDEENYGKEDEERDGTEDEEKYGNEDEEKHGNEDEETDGNEDEENDCKDDEDNDGKEDEEEEEQDNEAQMDLSTEMLELLFTAIAEKTNLKFLQVSGQDMDKDMDEIEGLEQMDNQDRMVLLEELMDQIGDDDQVSPQLFAAAVSNVEEVVLKEHCKEDITSKQYEALYKIIASEDRPLRKLTCLSWYIDPMGELGPELLSKAINKLEEFTTCNCGYVEQLTAILRGVVDGDSRLKKLMVEDINPLKVQNLDQNLIKEVKEKIGEFYTL